MTSKGDKGVHYAFYPSNWLSGTRGMTPAETGIFITLVAMMYEREAPLNFEAARLARMCNCPAGSFKQILAVLISEGKIIETPDGLWNRRVEKEIKAARDAMDEASDKAKKAAAARWEKAKPESGHREIDATTSQSGQQPIEDHTPENDNKINDGDVHKQSSSNATQTQTQRYKIRGGGIGEREDDPPPPPDDGPTWREQMLDAMGVSHSGIASPSKTSLGSRVDMECAARWETDLHLPRDRILIVMAETAAAKTDGPPSSFRYFNKAMQREAARLLEAPLQPAPANEVRNDRPTARDRRAAAADEALARRIIAAARID